MSFKLFRIRHHNSRFELNEIIDFFFERKANQLRLSVLDNMKICAVVVTYNRKELLEKQIIEIIHNQELKIDAYYVIDNCSTDGTRALIDKYDGSVIKYCRTESNCGGAGGFSYGLQCAFEDKYDWYILMDDDGRPMDKDCFGNMKRHIVKKGYDSQRPYLLNSLVLSDKDTLSFGLGHIESVTELNSVVTENEVVDMINPFNGTWISNGLIEKIGFPNGKFFIKGDENDYLRRAQSTGAFVATVVDSRYFHPKLGGYKKKKVFGKEMYVYIEPAWKEYYSVRNYTFSFLQFGKKKDAILFLIKRIYCCMVCNCNKLDVMKMLFKGYQDGKKGRLGATIKP